MTYMIDVTHYQYAGSRKERREKRNAMTDWLVEFVGPVLRSHPDGTAYAGDGWAFKTIREIDIDEEDALSRIDIKQKLYLQDEAKAAIFRLTWGDQL
jgi:hypothetical protein